jgi:hypothetical protein
MKFILFTLFPTLLWAQSVSMTSPNTSSINMSVGVPQSFTCLLSAPPTTNGWDTGYITYYRDGVDVNIGTFTLTSAQKTSGGSVTTTATIPTLPTNPTNTKVRCMFKTQWNATYNSTPTKTVNFVAAPVTNNCSIASPANNSPQGSPLTLVVNHGQTAASDLSKIKITGWKVGTSTIKTFVSSFNPATTATSSSFTFSLPSLTNGTNYNLRVTCSFTNPAQTITKDVVVVSSTPDTQAPSVPTSFSLNGSSTINSVPLKWNASTDNVAVTKYEIQRVSPLPVAVVGQSSTLTSILTGLTSGTAYQFNIRACDAANNCSAFSSTLSVSTAAVPNLAPVTVADSLNLNQETAGSINVLSNDTDPESQALSLTALSGHPSGVSFSSNGLVTVSANTPTGTYNMTYTVSDGVLSSSGILALSVTAPPTGGNSIAVGNGVDVIGVPVATDSYGPKAVYDCPNQQSANSIYVDSNFMGAPQGTFTAPYKDLTSLTSTVVTAGKTVCLKRGSEFNYNWTVGFNGTAASPITVTAYGDPSAPAPLFHRGLKISEWTLHSGNIYKTTNPVYITDLHKVFYQGDLQIQARHPNIGSWLWREIHPQSCSKPTGQFKVNNLASLFPGINLVGSEIVTRVTNWSFGVVDITSVSGDLINYTVPSKYAVQGYSYIGDSCSKRWGIYFKNHLSFLDAPGEWYHDPVTKILYFYAPEGVQPAANSVIVMQRDQQDSTLSSIYLSSKSYISFRNLDFQYAPFTSIRISGGTTGTNLEVKNCRFKNVQRGLWMVQDKNSTLTGNIFEDIFYESFRTVISAGGGVFTDNLLRRIGVAAPQKVAEYSVWYPFGVTLQSDVNSTPYNFSRNVISEVGYIGVSAYGNGLVENNLILKTNQTYNDGGAASFDYVRDNQTLTIRKNIVVESFGNLDGVDPNYYNYVQKAKGLYLGDQNLNNVDMDGNVIVGVRGQGIWMDHTFTNLSSGSYGPTRGHKARNNVIYDADGGIGHSDFSNYRYNDINAMGWPCGTRSAAGGCFNQNYNDVVEKNIIYRKKANHLFRYFLHVYSSGASSSFVYPNLNPTSNYLNRSNFFGLVDGVQGYSNRNVYVNPYASGNWGGVECAFGAAGGFNSCGNNQISLTHWKSGYHAQDLQSVEFTGLATTSSVSAQNRGKILINNTGVNQSFLLNSCSYKLSVDPTTSAPSMQAVNGSISIEPYSAVIIEQDC